MSVNGCLYLHPFTLETWKEFWNTYVSLGITVEMLPLYLANICLKLVKIYGFLLVYNAHRDVLCSTHAVLYVHTIYLYINSGRWYLSHVPITFATHANVFFVFLPGGISKKWRQIVRQIVTLRAKPAR